MSGRIGVLIPTRNRPEQLRGAIQSVRETSELADVLVYIDDFQNELYQPVMAEEASRADGRVMFLGGSHIDVPAACNLMVEQNPGFSAYGILTDNSRMKTPGWDRYLLEVVGLFPHRLGVISPWHNCGRFVDQPYVSREWIDVVGWYACPAFQHYAWPILTGLIGEMTGICHCPEEFFAIQHDYVAGHYDNKHRLDCEALHQYIVTDLTSVVNHLREAMTKPQEDS